MSTAATEASPSGPVVSLENLLFDFPEADVILRTRDSYEFRVLKLYIIHSSSILEDELLLSHNPEPEPSASTLSTNTAESNVEGTAANTPCVVQLPVEGAIIFSLLTYIFHVPPVLPSTVEQTMELLSVAQMYKMDVVLTQIRIHIAQQEPPFIREETAFLIYSLAQKYGLRTEALQAARCTLSFSSLTIEDLAKEEKFDMMPGAFLHELWKYHQRVRSNLTFDLKAFKSSNAPAILGESICDLLNGSGLPRWLDGYISDIGTDHVPASLDLTDFHMELSQHIENRKSFNGGCASCKCLGIPRNRIREFWRALTTTVRGSITKAEPDFVIPAEGTTSEASEDQTRSTCKDTSPKYSDMPNADVILQSSDLVHFRVHKLVLVASSPFFGDMFSLPQPPNDTASDELPVVHLSEDAEVLNSLISMLYPVPREIPPFSDNILALLAAAAKYDMEPVQSLIRGEVSRRGLLSSTRAGVFRVYAVAYCKGLIPEVATAARLTLGHPLTFESLGDSLRSFEGWALRDLAEFRLRSIRSFCSKWESFSSSDPPKGLLKKWSGSSCLTEKDLPIWLQDCLRLGPIPVERFTDHPHICSTL